MNATTQQEEAVFDAARELKDPGRRKAFLDQACGGDSGLRARVEQLLAAQTDAERFFAETGPALRPATEMRALTDGRTPGGTPGVKLQAEEQVGTCIGRYKLLQKIGEGGCGVVYMAEQEQPVRRRVALKIIKLGMDTKNVIARFEAERQALAMMDHPNIARVLDAGATDTGRPYFVMELVRGIRITEYCDKSQLDTDQRLDLFIQICHAIQHAHQKGIIHRDIKPSNILVTLHDGVPVPKVIDFGIAKATEARLTDKTLFTAYEQFIGTPAYMSPEQAEMSGLDIDTRSDIYSLGVLLYELLTGKTPFDARELVRSGMDAMRRTLREQEPQRPSTMVTTLQGTELTTTAHHRHAEPPRLISLLRGDLDWIVMKSLEKDRTRRYETANGLAMDVKRYLSNEPILARPPSRLYQFRKLVRRNKVVFAAAAAVTATLVLGSGTALWLYLRERAALRQQAALAEIAERARANEAKLRRQAETREKITQARVWVSEERQEDADKLMSEMPLNQSPSESAAVFRSLGEWHAVQGRWKQAAERFAVVLEINKPDGWDVASLDYLECGPALIESGATNQYDHFRRAAIARFAGAANPFTDRIIKVALLLPADRTVLSSLDPLAEVALSSFAGTTNNHDSGDVFQAAWQSVSLALLEYRRGDYPACTQWCRRCLAYPEHNAPRTATARVILAMSCQRLGETAEAQSQLALARDVIENKFRNRLDRGTGVQGFWFDWVFARILLREATALIEGGR